MLLDWLERLELQDRAVKTDSFPAFRSTRCGDGLLPTINCRDETAMWAILRSMTSEQHSLWDYHQKLNQAFATRESRIEKEALIIAGIGVSTSEGG